MKRRSFLRTMGGAAAGTTLGIPAVTSGQVATATELPRRVLGRTGLKASVVAFPGLALIQGDQEQGTAALHDAFRRSVNLFDVAPAYGNGEAEIKMGIGLQGLKREDYLLTCKTRARDKKGAREELERSLKRLKTDHFDVYQMHCLKRPAEVEEALGPGGAMETILEAKKEGKVRNVGFSAHTTVAALAAMKGFRFDTVMFPINFVEYYLMGFGKPVLELANEQGAAVLAIKVLSRGAWPQGMERTRRWWYRCTEEKELVDLAVRFTLSQPPVASTICPSFFDLLDKTIEAGKSFRPITEEETQQVRKLAEASESLFRREQQEVASATPSTEPIYPDSPHEGCCGHYA